MSTASAQNVPITYRHEADTNTCLNLLSRGIAHMKEKNLLRYKDLFQAVRLKVYAKSNFTDHTHQGPLAQPSGLTPSIPPLPLYSSFESVPPDSTEEMVSLTGDAYLSEVDGFLEGGLFDMDDALNAWYTTMLEEIQNQRPGNHH